MQAKISRTHERAHSLLLSFADGNSWDIVQTKDHAIVKELKERTEVPCYQAASMVTVPSMQLLLEYGLLEPAALKQWADVLDVQVVYNKPGNAASEKIEELPYQIILQRHAPILGGLISAREFLCARVWQTYPDGSFLFWTFSVDPADWPQDATTPYPAPSPSAVRGTLVLSAFRAYPKDKHGSGQVVQLHYIAQTGLGGRIPGWVVKKGVLHEITEAFHKLPEAVSSVQAQRQREGAP